MGNGSCQLSEEVLSHLFDFRVAATVLAGQGLLIQLFKVGLNEVIYSLATDISLNRKVPVGYLTEVSHLQNQVQVVVIVVIYHFVQLCDVRVV
jgi:hypothetical protein